MIAVNPARAGMIRSPDGDHQPGLGKPRASGDDPAASTFAASTKP